MAEREINVLEYANYRRYSFNRAHQVLFKRVCCSIFSKRRFIDTSINANNDLSEQLRMVYDETGRKPRGGVCVAPD